MPVSRVGGVLVVVVVAVLRRFHTFVQIDRVLTHWRGFRNGGVRVSACDSRTYIAELEISAWKRLAGLKDSQADSLMGRRGRSQRVLTCLFDKAA